MLGPGLLAVAALLWRGDREAHRDIARCDLGIETAMLMTPLAGAGDDPLA
ncbi:MAG: hypothetical protein WD271_16335 [Acidimicrobiia bacterium]